MDIPWAFQHQMGAFTEGGSRVPYKSVPDNVVFETWKRRAVEYITVQPTDDWDWLAIAQHHRLATRRLDWSLNPLNAAFFALREEDKSEAEIIAIRFKYTVRTETQSPMEALKVALFRPRALVSRIVRQEGVFTVHPDPATLLDAESSAVDGIFRIVIPENNRKTLPAQLAFYGINSATLFLGPRRPVGVR
jgi:FRG domain